MYASRVPEGVLTLLVVLFVCIASFGLGYIAGKDAGREGIVIQQRPKAEIEHVQESLSASAGQAIVSTPEEIPALSAGGQYVASKKGTKYHLPWCAGAKSMKEENKIWFNSKEEAEKAGYTPASNCKGI